MQKINTALRGLYKEKTVSKYLTNINKFLNSKENSRNKPRKVKFIKCNRIGFVPKMFMDQTGDEKIDKVKEKLKYALIYDEIQLLE